MLFTLAHLAFITDDDKVAYNGGVVEKNFWQWSQHQYQWEEITLVGQNVIKISLYSKAFY